MAVYVDDAMIPYRRMKMCHLWADTLDELLDMVDKIGVQRKWLQRPDVLLTTGHPHYEPDPRYEVGMNASWVHFDVASSKRDLALQHGAIPRDRYGPVEHNCKLAIATGDPDKVRRSRRMLRSIYRSRKLNG